MKNSLIMLLVATAVSLGSIGCSNDKDMTGDTARVQLKLIDSPGDYLEVNVEIVDIQYQGEDEAWTSLTPVDGYPINVGHLSHERIKHTGCRQNIESFRIRFFTGGALLS